MIERAELSMQRNKPCTVPARRTQWQQVGPQQGFFGVFPARTKALMNFPSTWGSNRNSVATSCILRLRPNDSAQNFRPVAVTAMLVCYALEKRSSWFIPAFAGSCLLGSAYGFLQGAWPFGLVEAVWAGVAARRWWSVQSRHIRA
jgi:hypothetical protein